MWLIREIKGVWFGGYGLVRFESFTWAQPTSATKWARDASSTSSSWRRICTQNFHFKRVFILWFTVVQLFCSTVFCLKHIANPKWLALSPIATKCNLQGTTMSRKHWPMNLGHFISQIMLKTNQPFYLIKANLTITSLVDTLGFKAFFID